MNMFWEHVFEFSINELQMHFEEVRTQWIKALKYQIVVEQRWNLVQTQRWNESNNILRIKTAPAQHFKSQNWFSLNIQHDLVFNDHIHQLYRAFVSWNFEHDDLTDDGIVVLT